MADYTGCSGITVIKEFHGTTRRMFDAKRQREAAIFRCSCRNKKKEHLNPQTTVDVIH